jgi:xylulose-5-phosphate/fructose-6-phosphate phosphoketolase
VKTQRSGRGREALSPALLRRMDVHWRAANYLSVGQIYRYDNPPLRRVLDRRRSRAMAHA